jgi:hypothetical protein
VGALADGAWQKVPTTVGVNTHVALARWRATGPGTHRAEPGSEVEELRGSAW